MSPFRFKICVIFWVFLSVNYCAHSADLTPKITYFYDGDTLKIKDAFSEYKLRLTDIDAPERNQIYGKTSRRALINLCENADVRVYVMGKDRYKRNVGKLICNNQDASVYMVKNGHAWFNKRYSMDYTLDLAEQESRLNQLGLWKQKNPTPPWVWRQKNPY
ncbi:MAG: hypothetical protein CTY10_07700 [Methylotenera sp.]|nr:MAG: hypothetical protein CTY10_07700 [Methylotenera sp.]